MTTYRSFIGRQWLASASGRTVQNINPADTRDMIGHSHEAMAVANDSEYDRSSSVFSNDPNDIYRFIEEIETGTNAP